MSRSWLRGRCDHSCRCCSLRDLPCAGHHRRKLLNADAVLAFDGELVTGDDELAVPPPRRRPAGDLSARRLHEVHGSGYVGEFGYPML